MISQELKTYIKSALEQGQTREAIKIALLSAGWTEADIEEGFRFIENEEIQFPPVSTQTDVEQAKGKTKKSFLKEKSMFRIAFDHAARVLVVILLILDPLFGKLLQLVLGGPFETLRFLLSTTGVIIMTLFNILAVFLGVLISTYWMSRSKGYIIREKKKILLYSSLIFFIVKFVLPISVTYALLRVVSFDFISWGNLGLIVLTAVFYISSDVFLKKQ